MTEESKKNNGRGSNDPRAKSFDIPKYVEKHYPELIELILETKSMDDKERQYWFHILPIMNDRQVNKLKNILISEKTKLAEIDAEYADKLQKIQKNRISYWEEQKLTARFDKIKMAEKEYEKEEQKKEAELLNKLEEI